MSRDGNIRSRRLASDLDFLSLLKGERLLSSPWFDILIALVGKTCVNLVVLCDFLALNLRDVTARAVNDNAV